MSKATTLIKAKEESKLKECFIITPLGATGSEIRRKADGLINVVLQPILEELNFSVIPPHKMLTSGSITIQIIQKLLNADLVVCNLTGLNPNVMYELAVRHASRKPVVCLYESGNTPLPFDIAAERTIFYTDDIAGVEAVKPVFKEYVQAAMEDQKPDNPIYRVAQEELIRAEAKPGDLNDLVLDRLNDLSLQINRQNSSYSTKSQLAHLLSSGSFWVEIDKDDVAKLKSILNFFKNNGTLNDFKLHEVKSKVFKVDYFTYSISGIEEIRRALQQNGLDFKTMRSDDNITSSND